MPFLKWFTGLCTILSYQISIKLGTSVLICTFGLLLRKILIQYDPPLCLDFKASQLGIDFLFLSKWNKNEFSTFKY